MFCRLGLRSRLHVVSPLYDVLPAVFLALNKMILMGLARTPLHHSAHRSPKMLEQRSAGSRFACFGFVALKKICGCGKQIIESLPVIMINYHTR